MVPLDSFAYDISAPNFQNNTCMPTYYLTENGFSILLDLNLTSFSGYCKNKINPFYEVKDNPNWVNLDF